jgi:hypothetical protein
VYKGSCFTASSPMFVVVFLMITIFFFFDSTEVWAQGLTLARQALCHLSHSTSQLTIAILTRVRQNLNVVLIYISFTAGEVEHLFMCLLAICTSFLNLVIVSFTMQKLFSFVQSHLFILSLICWAFELLFRKLLPMHICSSVFPITSYTCFKVSGFILRSLIHLSWYLNRVKDMD